MIQIKKGVPIPQRTFGGRPGAYPFNDMEVGDCFDVGLKGDEEAETVVRRLRVASTSWKKRVQANCGFAFRSVTEGDTALVRVWKTAPKIKAE